MWWRVRFNDQWLCMSTYHRVSAATVDRSAAVRLLTYVGLLYQDLDRVKATAPLRQKPPVLPHRAVYNGKSSGRQPCS